VEAVGRSGSFALHTATSNQTATQFRSLYRSDCVHFSLICLLLNFQCGRQSKKCMKRLIRAAGLAIGLVSLFACQPFTSEHSTLARVTVYWRGDGSGDHASSNGARLRESHCAVDPKNVPYGSKVAFPDTTCVAVDTGSDVVNRKAARLSGRNLAERNAIVIDRFFETKQKALAWAKAHPHFMTVQILTPATKQGTKLIATENPRSSPRNIASSSETSSAGSAE
jgi:hypothetical protein